MVIWKETLSYLKSIKLNSYPVKNVTYFSAGILVYYEHLESAGVFNPGNLGYINHILEYISDYIFHI